MLNRNPAVEKRACATCGAEAVALRLDLGRQPPSNRFLATGEWDEDRHAMVLGQCETCGLAQLIEPMPEQMVKARFDWLRYTEAEGHLDSLVERVCGLPELASSARIIGLSDKDDSMLERFRRAGRPNVRRLDLAMDLGISDPCAGLETLQRAMTPARAAGIVARHGLADVLVARHVIEHSHRPLEFLAACASLVRPAGLMVLEMPDCRKFLEAADHCFLWEEHVTYFTPSTLRTFLGVAGFSGAEVLGYPYALEDALVALVRNIPSAPSSPAADAGELDRCRRFGDSFALRRQEWRRELERIRAAGKRVGLFGAGHLAAKFLNLYDLGTMIDFVIDDNPKKKGLEMPGSRLPVIGSEVLSELDLCLLAVSPESEARVISAKQAFAAGGGVFASIFRRSAIGLPLAVRG